ncbi:MAG TPA: prepilin-type N-terminal cleavage/methylation domain-containing protein [Candidatus Omnitrophota bacterium]|nr:prepilin-type N-terminal cleavage/methylation domain-containing protein [Candidatus Omnitrophota bacterium]
MLNKKAFTLIEAIIVVAIVSVLASIAVPSYMQHVRRATAAEAVALMAMVREGLRDYNINNNTFFDIGSGNIPNGLPTSVASGIPTPSTAGVNADAGISHYFSNASYSVDATSPTSTRFANPSVVDFIISVDGSASVACGSSNCATSAALVSDYRLEMDNTDRVFVSYDGGTNWTPYR